MTVFENVLQAMTWKKSNSATAERLGMPLEEYMKVKRQIQQMQREEEDAENLLTDLQINGFAKGFTENLENGTAEYKIESSFKPRTAEEIESLIQLDKTKYKLSRYSIWNGGKEDVWLISAKVTALVDDTDPLQQFQEFLKSYKPKSESIKNIYKSSKKNGMLIINKQDAHLNKYSIDGNNSMEKRFSNIVEKTKSILDSSVFTSNLSKVTYILGSDIFDSEWTEMTTKGTPQKSVMPYQKSFEAICNHEITMISLILQYTDNLYIPFLTGNHDQFVGWHLVNWLQAYFKDCPNVMFDCGTSNSKYMRFGNSGFMLNHGDGMKPEKLAQVFPLEFKDEWSNCKYYSILTGDKHHEITRDIGGIRFFQVPAWSKAVSNWDSKHGWTMVNPEIQALFVTEDRGITTRYTEPL